MYNFVFLQQVLQQVSRQDLQQILQVLQKVLQQHLAWFKSYAFNYNVLFCKH
jgi:hypothetical protein